MSVENKPSLTLDHLKCGANYVVKSDKEMIEDIIKKIEDKFVSLQQQIDQLKKLRNQHEDYVVKLTEINDADMQELSDRLEIVEAKIHGKR